VRWEVECSGVGKGLIVAPCVVGTFFPVVRAFFCSVDGVF